MNYDAPAVRLPVMRLVLLIVLATATAHADPCTTPPSNAKLRSLSLVRATADKGMGFDPGFTAAAGSEFPAVSNDGKKVAQLFVDAEDFTGAPVSTLAIYSVANARLIDSVTVGGSQPDPDIATKLKTANKLLAGTRWTPLPTSQACDSGLVIDGRTFKYDVDTNKLTQTRGKQTSVVTAGFPQSGTRMGNKEDGAGSPCGDVLGLESGFGTGGLIVIVPRSQFGGDSCFGALGVARSVAFVVR